MENAKTYMRKTNDYDQWKVITDFQLKDIIKKGRKKRFKPLIELNSKYKLQVEHMRETVRNNELKRINKLKKEIKEKEKKIKEKKEFLYSELKDRNSHQRKLKDEKIKKVLEQFEEARKEEEKIRLEEAERTQLKLKEYMNKLFEKRKLKEKEFEEKSIKKILDHERNLSLRDEKYEKEIRERDERAFQKYNKAFWSKKSRILLARQSKQI